MNRVVLAGLERYLLYGVNQEIDSLPQAALSPVPYNRRRLKLSGLEVVLGRLSRPDGHLDPQRTFPEATARGPCGDWGENAALVPKPAARGKRRLVSR